MSQKKVAPFTVTEDQRKWLDKESKRTLETQASVLRKLIQEKIDNEIAIKK